MGTILVTPNVDLRGDRSKLLSTSVYSYEYGTRRRLRSDDIVGARMFPTPTAGDGQLRIDPVTSVPDMYRCGLCGFGCVLKNGIVSPGTANQGDGFQINDSVTGDPVGGRPGCPFCATGNSRRIGIHNL